MSPAIGRDQSVLTNMFSEAIGSVPFESGVLDGEVNYWIWEAKQGETLTWTTPQHGWDFM